MFSIVPDPERFGKDLDPDPRIHLLLSYRSGSGSYQQWLNGFQDTNIIHFFLYIFCVLHTVGTVHFHKSLKITSFLEATIV